MGLSVNVTAGGVGRYGESRGYFQGTISGPSGLAQIVQSVSGSGSSIPLGANMALITVEGNCRWTADGVGATVTRGTPLSGGVTLNYTLNLGKFSICPATVGGSVVVNVEFVTNGL